MRKVVGHHRVNEGIGESAERRLEKLGARNWDGRVKL